MDKFFQTCNKSDSESTLDLLLHRYHNIEYIMKLDIETALRLIKKAEEKEKENRYFLQWVVQLPNMTKENFVSFEAYLDKLTGRNIDRRPISEIMAEIEEIEKSFE